MIEELYDINNLGASDVVRNISNETIAQYMVLFVDVLKNEQALKRFEASQNERLYQADEARMIQTTAIKWVCDHVEWNVERKLIDAYNEDISITPKISDSEHLDDFKMQIIGEIMKNANARIGYYS